MPVAETPYAWSLAPQILLTAALVGGIYARRFRELRSRARGVGPSGGPDGEALVLRGPAAGAPSYLRALSFAAGLVVLVLALVSPIDSLGEERLFSAHMVQHLLLTDIAPILLLLGLSRPLMRPLVRRLHPLERRLGPLASPVAALILLVLVMWAWHVPFMYELALEHTWAHELEHLAFLTAGIAFWWYVIEPVPPHRRLGGMATLGYLTAAKLLLGALGVLLAFSPNAIYDTYEEAPRTWGLTAVEDLNVGGLTMLLEQSTVLVIFFAIAFVRMLDQSEAAERRRERFGL